jgi:hypothetical protein
MIYPGRNPNQTRTANKPWFRIDLAGDCDDALYVVNGSAIDAPDFIPSGSTKIEGNNPFAFMVREVPREA